MSQQQPTDSIDYQVLTSARVAEVIDLLRAARASGELRNFSDPEFDRLYARFEDLPGESTIALADGTIAGLNAENGLVLYVRPEWRQRGIGRRLVELSLANEPEMELVPDENEPGSFDFLRAIGFSYDHQMQQMRRPAELPAVEINVPDGFALRSYEHRDFERYFPLWNRAFLDHPTPLQTTIERMSAAHNRAGFDPASISLIHRAEDRDDLVGFITTRPVFEENGEPVGPIGSIGTDRSVRGLGLGRVLLRRGIERLKQHGAGAINLEVVTINERALSLYESEGFLPKQSWEFWKASRTQAAGS
jgi:mycothiol synthase